MQDGRKVREPDRGLSETLELVSPCKTNQRSLENTDLIRKELEMILEWDVLPAKIPEFPTVFAGMNNQLTLFASMNEIQELVAARLKSKTKVVFTSSPGYSSMPPALQLVNAILVLIAQSSGLRMLMAVPNRELEPANLRLLKSERAAAWAEVSRILRGFYEPASILIVLDEVLCQEISNLVTLRIDRYLTLVLLCSIT